MNKSELIKKIHSTLDYNYDDIENIVDSIFNEISLALVTEEKVVISGFGTFEKYYQSGHSGVNPSTGEPILVNDSNKIRFKASRILKDAVNK